MGIGRALRWILKKISLSLKGVVRAFKTRSEYRDYLHRKSERSTILIT